MATLLDQVSDSTLGSMESLMNDWVFYVSIGLFACELLRYAVFKRMSWNLVGDSVANALVQGAYLVLSYTLFFGLYGLAFYSVHQFALFDIETTWVSLIVCVFLADLCYYWEHRFTHRVAVAWATHQVHHSSPHFNISVAYRFGPLDDLWPIAFNLPLVALGFDPLVVIFTTLFVLQYQTFLHTEAVKKLPWIIEAVMNTPSHHRVHHGSNPQYLDKNYGGMFIIWDRLFGTFQAEEEPVVYGLTKQIESVNPVVVFFHGLYELGAKLVRTPGLVNKVRALVMPPGWGPPAPRPAASAMPAE